MSTFMGRITQTFKANAEILPMAAAAGAIGGFVVGKLSGFSAGRCALAYSIALLARFSLMILAASNCKKRSSINLAYALSHTVWAALSITILSKQGLLGNKMKTVAVLIYSASSLYFLFKARKDFRQETGLSPRLQ